MGAEAERLVLLAAKTIYEQSNWKIIALRDLVVDTGKGLTVTIVIENENNGERAVLAANYVASTNTWSSNAVSRTKNDEWREDAGKRGPRGKRTKVPNCTKQACGMSCIPWSKTCHQKPQGVAEEALVRVVGSGGSTGGGGAGGVAQSSTPETYAIPIAPTKDMKLIGKGAFGAVYLDEKNNVALKYVTLADPVLAQFYSGSDEIRMMQKASDAGVGPKFFGTSQDADGNPIIAMEYLKGFVPLKGTDAGATYKELNALSEKRQAKVIANTLKAIEQMANAGIVHNDAHTGNIMFNPKTGDVKMVDMGLASEGSEMYTDLSRFISSLANIGSAWKSSQSMREPLTRFPRVMDQLIKEYEDIANG